MSDQNCYRSIRKSRQAELMETTLIFYSIAKCSVSKVCKSEYLAI